jgi:hypothetical protein
MAGVHPSLAALAAQRNGRRIVRAPGRRLSIGRAHAERHAACALCSAHAVVQIAPHTATGPRPPSLTRNLVASATSCSRTSVQGPPAGYPLDADGR